MQPSHLHGRRARTLIRNPFAPARLVLVPLEDRLAPAITGLVFTDYNADGTYSPNRSIPNAGVGTVPVASDVGLGGVTVTAFDTSGAVAGTATTDAAGQYVLTPSGSGPYRVEFTGLPAGYSYGPTGVTAGPAVQFVGTGTAANVNTAAVRGSDFSPDDPLLVTSSYVFGGISGADPNNGLSVVVSAPYSAGSDVTDPIRTNHQSANGTLALRHSQVGATWGLAYAGPTQTLYAAAFQKRHTGYGPNGPGAVYAAAPDGTVKALADLNAVFADRPAGDLSRVFTDSNGNPVAYRNDVPTSGATDTYWLDDGLRRVTDSNGVQRDVGWDSAGKLALGGLDLSADGRRLFTVALADRRLYSIPTTGDVNATTVQRFALPVPASVTGRTAANPLGDLRPFAVEEHRGLIYIGAVNSAESSQNRADLRAYVFAFDPARGVFVNAARQATTTEAVIDFALNYDRGITHKGGELNPNYNPNVAPPDPAEWNPWSPTFRSVPQQPFALGRVNNPQPMLTGLAFDTAGNVTLGLRDRLGDQIGVVAPANPLEPNNFSYFGMTAGDTLRAFVNTPFALDSAQTNPNQPLPGWTLESNGRSPTGQGNAPRNSGQGIGGGEYYYQDDLPRDPTQRPVGVETEHDELSVGGVLQLAGFPDVVTTSFDPVRQRDYVNSGGFRWFSNDTGAMRKSYEEYVTPFTPNPPTFAKANGMGDLIAVTQTPPIEIGDRVWTDTNGNGVQDPGEAGIGGVRVELYDAAGALLGFTTTDVGGSFSFSSGTGASTNSRLTGLNLLPGTGYELRIPLGQVPLGDRVPTRAFADAGALGGLRDSNAVRSGDAAVIAVTTPAAGGGDATFDVGFIPRPIVAVGDFVWNDLNNSGTLDAGEAGVGGVRVNLLRPDGSVVATTTTGGGGLYLFDNLDPGDYRIEIVPPAGFTSSTGALGSLTGPYEPGATANTDNVDHGTQSGAAIRSAVFTLFAPGDTRNPGTTGRVANDANLTLDFGLIRPLSIGDTVWEDRNNDGVKQASEPGIAGVSLVLRDGAGATIATTTTNAAGGYLFTNLIPGAYSVAVDRSTLPSAAYRSSTGSRTGARGPFEPAPGDTVDGTDHGSTANGLVVGPRVQLDYGTAPTDEAPTDEAPTPGGIADPARNEDSNRRQDFGFFRPLSIGNLVWEDVDNSGTRNGAEPGVSGVTVELLDGVGAVVGTTTTAADGTYLFTDLTAGRYTVRVTPPAGYRSSTGQPRNLVSGPFEPGTAANTDDIDHGTTTGRTITAAPIDLAAAEAGTNPDDGGLANLKQDFGLFRPLSIGNFVWADANNDGKLSAGETGLSGVAVLLFENGTPIGRTTTDAGGGYRFDGLAPGTYTVRVLPPAGFRSSTGSASPDAGPYEPGKGGNEDNEDHGTTTPDGIDSTVVLAAPTGNPDEGGLANLRQDFGLFRPLSVGNFVWNDVNNNGRLDTGESPLAGVAVDLLDASGAVVAATSTDADGNYLFGNLTAGTYQVRITPPAGFVSSTGANGSKSGPYEPGVGGTQDNEDHGTAAGSAVVAAPVTLTADGNPDLDGTANLRQDFGLFRPLSIGNRVFRDANNDGRLGADEAGIAGVPVRLLDGTNTVIASATTDSTGGYLFTDLSPGAYTVEITPPAGLVSSSGSPGSPTGPFEPLLKDDGSDETDKGSAAGDVIRTNPVVLTETGNPSLDGFGNLLQDFGLTAPPPPVVPPTTPPVVPPVSPPPVVVPPTTTPPVQNPAAVSGYVYRDTATIDGRREPGRGETGIPGTLVTLTGTETNGTPVPARTAVTDRNGFYRFDNLPAGSYSISERQPPGFLDGFDTPGSLGGATPRNDVLTVTLAAGDDGVEYNFGEILPGAVFGFVYEDVNRNRRRDPGEPGIGNVAITISGTAFDGTPLARPLTAGDSIVGLTVRTDANGRWEFPVLPIGAYSIVEAQPAGYDDFFESVQEAVTRPVTTGNDIFSGVPIAAAETRGPLNFGEVRPAVTVPDDPTKRDFLGSPNPNGGGTISVPPTVTPPVSTGPTDLPLNPPFAVNSGNPAVARLVVTAAGSGRAPLVRVFDYATGTEKFKFYAYEGTFTGGVRVATADVNGDGTEDVITATGLGGGPRIRVFSGVDGSQINEFFAYEPSFRGGVFVAAADITGDGKADIITGTEIGGGPRVTVFDGATGQVIRNFFAFAPEQRGGVRVAAADFNADGLADLVVSTGAGVPTRVRVFDGAANNQLTEFAPYAPDFTGGVFVAAGLVLNAGGTPDIVTSADSGGGPHVQVFGGLTGRAATSFYAYEPTYTGGARVALSDVNGDGRQELIVSPGAGRTSQVRILSADGSEVEAFAAFDPTYTDGVYVG